MDGRCKKDFGEFYELVTGEELVRFLQITYYKRHTYILWYLKAGDGTPNSEVGY